MSSKTFVPTPARPVKPARVTEGGNGATIIRNIGQHVRRVVVGVPTLGTIRYAWHVHNHGQVIPINWMSATVVAEHYPTTIGVVNYAVADAQNVIIERAYLDNYEWALLYEDDVLPPFDAYLRLGKIMDEGKAPIVSGLYYSKGNPSWPLLFRGRGNGAFTDFTLPVHNPEQRKALGLPKEMRPEEHEVWVDGVPTGFLLIHKSIFRYAWEHAPDYALPDGRKIKQVFKTPRDSWYDPEQDRYFAKMGTSDLYFCDWILDNDILRKTGWPALAKQKYPFLVDTAIYCKQIDLNGVVYPDGVERLLTTGEKKPMAKPRKKTRAR